MITVAEPIDLDALRIRNEFLTVPDLCASVDSCAQFLDVPPRHALLILESLVHEGFLQRNGDGRYVRTASPPALVPFTQPGGRSCG